MPESPFGCINFQSTRNSKSPYAFSVARCTPLPSDTSSPLTGSTLQCRSRSAFHSLRFASRSSGVNFASTYGLNTPPPPGRPRQPLKSLPLNRTVKPSGAFGGGAGAFAGAGACASSRDEAARPITVENTAEQENRIVGILRGT